MYNYEELEKQIENAKTQEEIDRVSAIAALNRSEALVGTKQLLKEIDELLK